MPAPDLSTRQIALLFKDLVHYVFGASGTVFTNNFLSISIFYPALCQQGFPKFMPAGDLSKLEISKTFYKHYMRVASFDFGEIQTQKTIFFWGQIISIFTPSSHWELFISVCCQTTYQTNVMNNIFLCQHFTKRIQSSADGTSRLVTSSLTCLWAFSCASVLTHQFTCGKSNQFTNLQTHSGLEGICLFRKKAFQFELLFYCLLFANLLLWILTCLTWAQPSHTHKNWTNRETCTAYQKWSRISLWLCWISERAFVH